MPRFKLGAVGYFSLPMPWPDSSAQVRWPLPSRSIPLIILLATLRSLRGVRHSRAVMASGRAPAIPRPPLARRPRRPNDNDVVPMRLINELFTAWRILVPGDRGAGARSPNTSKPAPDHRVYPYLLRNRTIDRPNHVRAADITNLPIGPGTGALMAAGINISMDGRRRRMDNVFIERVRRSRQPSRVLPTERRSFVPRTIFQCQTSY